MIFLSCKKLPSDGDISSELNWLENGGNEIFCNWKTNYDSQEQKDQIASSDAEIRLINETIGNYYWHILLQWL